MPVKSKKKKGSKSSQQKEMAPQTKRSRKGKSAEISDAAAQVSPASKMQNASGDDASITLLDVTFSRSEFVTHFTPPNWPKSFRKTFGTAYGAILAAVPDVEGIEKVQALVAEIHSSQESSSIHAAAISTLTLEMLADSLSSPTAAAVGRVATAYGLTNLLRSGQSQTAQLATNKIVREATVSLDSLSTDPLLFLLSAVESPLIMATGLKKLERSRAVSKRAIESFVIFLEQCFDSSGWIHHRFLSELGPIIAAICRIRTLIEIAELKLSKSTREQCEWVGLQFARMLNSEKQVMLSQGWLANANWLLLALRELTRDSAEDTLFKKLAKGSLPKQKKMNVTDLPGSADYGSEARVGAMHCGWYPHSPRVGILAGDDGMQLEIASDIPLISGLAMPELKLNGKTIAFANHDFQMNCWFTDDDVHYLELELELVGGGVWQRQFTLCRSDEILFVTDAFLLNDTQTSIEYQCDFTLADSIVAQPEAETREVYLKSGERFSGLVIPMTTGEWRNDRTGQELQTVDNQLCLRQTGQGKSFMTGLAFGLDISQVTAPRTWRRLSVGEKLVNVPADTAVAYRIQIGQKQWILYRNLSHIGNRTFIGKNVHTDFLVGRFLSDGTIEHLIEIE